MTDMGNFGGNLSGPSRMNNRGQVVGQSNLAGDVSFHAFLWERGVLRDLGTLGGSTSRAISINDAGDVVGVADLPGDATHDAVLWKKRKIIDLGNLGKTSLAQDINNSGQIVGASRLADGTTLHAFLWEKSGPMVDLNDLIPQPSALTLAYAQVINDRGIISGKAIPAGCNGGLSCQHAFVLIPDGDCDDDCEQRIAVSQSNAALMRQNTAATTQRAEPPLSPIERIRNQMRRGYHFPGQHPIQRD
jgi:probable HAF family extracellular repeat protein